MAISYRKILSAMLSRAIFTVHGFLLVWQVVLIKGNSYYWMLVIGLLLLYMEMVLTLMLTRKGEWKCLYVVTECYFNPGPSPEPCMMLRFHQPFIYEEQLPIYTYCIHHQPVHLILGIPILRLIVFVSNFEPSHQWLEALEQVMVLVLVIGRWLMPKGEMSRDQLSQLLLIYIGLGADLLDILLLIKEPLVDTNWNVAIVGLSLFSWAVLQFTLVLTQTGPSTPERSVNDGDPESPDTRESCASSCCTSEVWSLVIAVIMQDGPFLVFRLYLTIKERVLNEMMIFFICKNILTVFLELYRIAVIQYQGSKNKNK